MSAHVVRVHLWERLVLPVRAQDGSLRLVVFNKPREYLDDLMRAVLDASPEGVLGLRCIRNSDGEVENAMVVTVNQRAADIIGCTVADLMDHSILDVIPSSATPQAGHAILRLSGTRQPQRSSFRSVIAVRSDGSM